MSKILEWFPVLPLRVFCTAASYLLVNAIYMTPLVDVSPCLDGQMLQLAGPGEALPCVSGAQSKLNCRCPRGGHTVNKCKCYT